MIFDTLNDEQRAIVLELKDFVLTRKEREVLIEGPAGSGKTYMMRALVEVLKKRIVFTAPTNKAVKVLRDAITSEDYKPFAKTIYALLGLKLMPNGEVKELKAPDEDVDLSQFSVVVVDEASMVNTILRSHINGAQARYPHLKWILMGDRNQLPPVGEPESLVWAIKDSFVLKRIMRHDNTILQLADHCRENIVLPRRAFTPKATKEVWPMTNVDFLMHMRENSAAFLAGRAKAIAWRNVKVDELNGMIRKQLFSEPERYPWQPGDRVALLEPYSDPNSDKEELLATTDDEGTVERAEEASHPIFTGFPCWRIVITKDDNQVITVWALHKSAQGLFEREKARLAAEAKVSPRKWGEFWEFVEAFAKVRHAYAITAHKSQGSTYENAYVNWRDIMLNDNRVEAWKCLYVAVTRARKGVYLG